MRTYTQDLLDQIVAMPVGESIIVTCVGPDEFRVERTMSVDTLDRAAMAARVWADDGPEIVAYWTLVCAANSGIDLTKLDTFRLLGELPDPPGIPDVG